MTNRRSRGESARGRSRIPGRTGRRDWLWGVTFGVLVLAIGGGAFNGQRYEGNPADVPLKDQESIVLQFGPPFADPNQFQFAAQ